MHHLYPSLKGDQLCPLGFHPQTRYPTRCKRCFRDYKEHGGRRGAEDVASSSPNLTENLNANQSSRTWTSTQNLSAVSNGNGHRNNNDIVVHFNVELKKRPQSWAMDEEVNVQRSSSSTAVKTANNNNVDVSFSLPIPPRRHTTTLDLKEVESSLATKSSTSNGKSSSPRPSIPDELVILSTDSLAERVRKMNLLKKQRSTSRERSLPKKSAEEDSEAAAKPAPERPERSKANVPTAEERKSLPPKKVTTNTSALEALAQKTVLSATPVVKSSATLNKEPEALNDVSILLKSSSVSKISPTSSSKPNSISKTITLKKTTSETQVPKLAEKNRVEDVKAKVPTISISNHKVTTNSDELSNEIKTLRSELSAMKTRAERAEREKSDILLRRLASLDTGTNRTAASEALALQQRVNELTAELEKVNDEKRKLNTRMREIENKPKESDYELKRKLQAAEQLCEELMEENQDAKKEIQNLQNEMDELQDTYRDDEVKQKANLQKDLEKSVKNCRILSFKLKKCERRIETLEQEQQGEALLMKVKQLEDELRFSNDLAYKLQAEAEELRNPGKKKNPTLKVIGRSTSADGKVTREMLTRGGSQEDPQQLLRDLQDSVERESDLKDQLKFAEEEAENLRKKVARCEDENDSLMMQLKKMAAKSRGRKLSPNSHHLAVMGVANDHDEGISDEEDPNELRILLELNEQEASKLRLKVDNLEKENYDVKKQVKELQDKLWLDSENNKKSGLLNTKTACADASINKTNNTAESKIKALSQEIEKLLRTCNEKDILIERIQAEYSMKNLRGSNLEITKLNEALLRAERERDEVTAKLKRYVGEAHSKLPSRSPKRVTDLTPKNTLKKWVEELEDEINEMRLIVSSCEGNKLQILENDKKNLMDELNKYKDKLSIAENDLQKLKGTTTSPQKVSDMEKKLKQSEDDAKKLVTKIRNLEDKIKAQDTQIKTNEKAKNAAEVKSRSDAEKLSSLEADYEKERKERKKLEAKVKLMDDEMALARKSFEKEIKELKSKSSSSKLDSKQVQELKKQMTDLQSELVEEKKRYEDLNTHWEKLSEETILMRAQLTTEKENLEMEISVMKLKLDEMETIRIDRTALAKKLSEAQRKIKELEMKKNQNSSNDHERSMLKNKLQEKEIEYDRLRRENEMNIDLVFQLRKDNDDLSSKLNDFQRIEQAQSSINGYTSKLESDIKELKSKLEGAEIQLKSEVAATRLRYEQQMKNLSAELTAMQRQCEKFKKDRDSFKHMLESAQKKIQDLKKNGSGRQSRSSMHSSDDDDKSKIAYLEQQVGNLEDQLVEARLEASRIKTEMVSERSANEIKISEMKSKLNELEEERVIGSGRTKIPGMKSKLELSWQKEREDQQRLLQETSTLARDLRQTLFEVERERDKERLESKRRLEQLKRTTEEEMEEGRKKIAELQCDLLELRDVHAKIRTSNEKLRRERERYEKELVRRRMEQDGGERHLNALLQSVDELIKVAPELKLAKAEAASSKRSPSPSPSVSSSSHMSQILARLAETSNDVRRLQQRSADEEMELRIRRGVIRRAASQENDGRGSTSSIASNSSRNGSKLSRLSQYNNSLMRKSLSLDQAMQQDQNIWRQDDGSVSSIQSYDSDVSRLDSRLSGGSTQSDIPHGPRKKKKGLMGKLRSLTKSSRNSESEVSVQGSESDASVASDMRASRKDLRGRLSGMFKRSGSNSRQSSMEQVDAEPRPVAVTVVGDENGPEPRKPPPTTATALRPVRTIKKPPTPSPSSTPNTFTRRPLTK